MAGLVSKALVTLGVGSTAAGPLGSLLFLGISVGLSMLFQPKVPKPEATRIPVSQDIQNRIYIIGRHRSAGAHLLRFGAAGGTYYNVVALCEGLANAFHDMWLQDDKVTFTGDGITIAGTGGRYSGGKVKIYKRYGERPETAYSQFVSALDPAGDHTGIWTEDHRGDGIVTTGMIAADAGQDEQATKFPAGLPVQSHEIDVDQVFDPRDPDQDWSDETTYRAANDAGVPLNDNPILQAVRFLSKSISRGGCGIDFEEAFLPILDQISAQADICDEIVARGIINDGGTERRYRSNAYYLGNTEPGEVLSGILGTCDGIGFERGDGVIELKAGKWDDEDFEIVIKDKHIINNRFHRYRPDEDEVAGIIVKYTSPAHDYSQVDAPVYPPTAHPGGTDRRVRPIEITYCPSGTQAQRLGKRVALYEMAIGTGTMLINNYGALLTDRRGMTIQSSDDPMLADAKAKITRLRENIVAGTFEVDYTVFDPVECDSWDPATEEGHLLPVTNMPIPGNFSEPTSLVAVASQVGANTIVEIGFDPGDVVGPNTEYHWHWRFASDPSDGWRASGNFSADAVDRLGGDHFWVVTFTGLPAGNLVFQLQAHQHENSSWSIDVPVDTSSLVAPGRVTAPGAVLAGADVSVSWTAPDSTTFHHARVYRANSGDGIGGASDISGALAGAALAAMTYTDTAPASGVYDYWVVAQDVADFSSLPRGPKTVTVP